MSLDRESDAHHEEAGHDGVVVGSPNQSEQHQGVHRGEHEGLTGVSIESARENDNPVADHGDGESLEETKPENGPEFVGSSNPVDRTVEKEEERGRRGRARYPHSGSTGVT